MNTIDTTSHKIIEILQQIETKNEILNEVINTIFKYFPLYNLNQTKKSLKITELIQPSGTNKLKKSLKQTDTFGKLK